MKFLKVLLFLICICAAVTVHAQSSIELKKQRDRLNDELEQLNQQLQQTQNNKKFTLQQVNLLKRQINLREQKIENINSEVRNLDNQITTNTNTVHNLQSQLDLLKKEYANMVLFAYHNQSAYNKLMFIFAAKDFNQAYKRLKYLQQFATYRERQAASIQNKQQDLHVKIEELDKTKEQKHTLLVDQQKEKAELGKERNNQLKVVGNLSQQEKQLQARQREIQRERERLRQQIIRKEIEEERKRQEEEERQAAAKAKAANKAAPVVAKPVARKTNSELLNATPEAAKLSSDFLGNKGQLPWPVANGKIINGFGIYYTEGIKNDNTGITVKTNPGAPVRAVFNGEVVLAADVSGTYTVTIRHGEYFTTYSNLRSITVATGQKVNTKQNIGSVAVDMMTGDPQLEFSLSKGITNVDPKIWLTPDR